MSESILKSEVYDNVKILQYPPVQRNEDVSVSVLFGYSHENNNNNNNNNKQTNKNQKEKEKTSESDPHSYEATKAVVKKAQIFFCVFFVNALWASQLRGSLSLVFSIRSLQYMIYIIYIVSQRTKTNRPC